MQEDCLLPCSHTLLPPHDLQSLFLLPCSHFAGPPQILQSFFLLACGQRGEQSLQLCLTSPCLQLLAAMQSEHFLLSKIPCSQTPQSLHVCLMNPFFGLSLYLRPCSHNLSFLVTTASSEMDDFVVLSRASTAACISA